MQRLPPMNLPWFICRMMLVLAMNRPAKLRHKTNNCPAGHRRCARASTFAFRAVLVRCQHPWGTDSGTARSSRARTHSVVSGHD
jgi:hypothetical protein